MAVLASVKAEGLWRAMRSPGDTQAAWRGAIVAPARASQPPAAPAPASAPTAAPISATGQPLQQAVPPNAQEEAERSVLEALRQRRGQIEARESALGLRETVIAATERRIAQRLEELSAIQRRLEALEAGRGEREDAAWRGLVRTYETMRPRDAATIFDDMEMPVLVQILDRMGERRAAPVIGAMRPERARTVTSELARHRTQRTTSTN